MKYCSTTLILLLLALNFISCKKDKDNAPPSSAPLMGTWELRSAISGSNGGSINYPAGNGKLLKFSDGNKYESTGTGLSDGSGTFQLTSEVFRDNNNQRVTLIRLNDSETRYSFTIKKDSLSLSLYPYDDRGHMIMDGGSSGYVRIQ